MQTDLWMNCDDDDDGVKPQTFLHPAFVGLVRTLLNLLIPGLVGQLCD